MAISTFDGPVRSLGGIYQQGPASVVSITSSTTLDPVSHGGRIISVGGSLAATTTLTLPTINTSSNPTTSGSLINGPTFDSGSGGSIFFDGADDYVRIQNNLNPSNITVDIIFHNMNLLYKPLKLYLSIINQKCSLIFILYFII